MLEDWKLIESREIFKGKIFDIHEKLYHKPEKLGEFKADVIILPDWVNIIGVNDEGNILLIRQFRFGTDRIELEIPAGIIEPGEDPEKAAIRELKEETGYGVKTIKKIGVVSANPGFLNNKCYTYLASLSTKGEVNFDPNEIIESEFATPSQVRKYLNEGKITNAFGAIGFLWYSLYKNGLHF